MNMVGTPYRPVARFFGDGGQGQQRVEAVIGVDHGGAVGDAAQVAHHHAEAVVQRHRDHQTILRGEAQAFADHVTVIEDVVVTEGGALGEAGGAGGVLDIDGLIEVQAGLARDQSLRRDASPQGPPIATRAETPGRARRQG